MNVTVARELTLSARRIRVASSVAFALFALFAILPGTLRAELRWNQTEIELSPKSTEKVATGEFVFTNTGTTSILINSIHPDCTCVTTPLEKTSYLPGESGRIAATFKMGGQTGEHTVPIQVQSQEGGQATSAVLLFRVKIVDVVTFSQRFLYWKANEALEPKIVTITLLAGEPITLHGVRVGNPAFQADLSPTDDPRRFQLRVTPPAQYSRGICPISLSIQRTDSSDRFEQNLVARLL